MLPDSMAAAVKKGQDSGWTRWFAIETPPAEHPWIISRLLSPPNRSMFCETHSKAKRWS
jgi:hypothetical protein